MNYEGGKAMPRRIHSVLVILVFAVILGFAFAGRVAAQSRAAEITGTVTDSSGAVVPGARVSLTNVATGARTDLTTTAAGLYYARLNPGTYRIVVERQGFKDHLQSFRLERALGAQFQSGQCALSSSIASPRTFDRSRGISH